MSGVRVLRLMMLALLVVFACPAPLRAAPAAELDAVKQRCVDSYQRAQELRLAAKLRAAREALLQCAADACPGVAKSQCARWLTEVDEAIPTVVLQYVDAAGRDRRDVAVSLDGETLVHELDGRPVRVDPGVHELRFTPADGPPVVREAIVKAGDKNQLVAVRLTAASSASPDERAPSPPAGDGRDTVHPATWVLAAVAAVGLAAFAGFGVHSLSLEDDCAPTCSDEQVHEVKAFRAAADVSLGVGAASLAGALVVMVISWPSASARPAAAARLGRAPAFGGGLGASWSF